VGQQPFALTDVTNISQSFTCTHHILNTVDIKHFLLADKDKTAHSGQRLIDPANKSSRRCIKMVVIHGTLKLHK
jgi:hypothetical protein